MLCFVELCIGSETPVDLVTGYHLNFNEIFFMRANIFCKWKYVNKIRHLLCSAFLPRMTTVLIQNSLHMQDLSMLAKFLKCFVFFTDINSIKS